MDHTEIVSEYMGWIHLAQDRSISAHGNGTSGFINVGWIHPAQERSIWPYGNEALGSINVGNFLIA
jgi:hypothetical protein